MATYAIVHGAGDTGSHWDLVAEQLRGRGHEVVAPDLPSEDDSAGWNEYASTVVEAVGERDELVVVAHSLGGFTAPLVCERLPAQLLVLVQAMIPAPGERAGEWWGNTGLREATGEQDYDDEIALFLHDVPAELASEALAKGRDQSGTPMDEPLPLAAWPAVPTRYLLCRDDRFFPADWLREVVRERLGVEPDEIDGGHCPYLSRPAELAERLEELRLG